MLSFISCKNSFIVYFKMGIYWMLKVWFIINWKFKIKIDFLFILDSFRNFIGIK